MSAIEWSGHYVNSDGSRGADRWHVHVPMGWPGEYREGYADAWEADKVGKIAFFWEDEVQGDPQGIAFDAQLPLTLISGFLGRHPENLVEGFTAMEKPPGFEWMARSRIKSIISHMGSVLIELEPSQGEA